MKTVTFETKCWQGDWEAILNNGSFQIKIKDFNEFNFTEKNLIINNVLDTKAVCSAAKKLKDKGVIDNWYLVSDYEKTVLEYFGITRDSFLWKEMNNCHITYLLINCVHCTQYNVHIPHIACSKCLILYENPTRSVKESLINSL